MRRCFGFVLFGIGCLVSVSCSSGSGSGTLNPTHGKVLLNNQPLGGALVTFHPKGVDDIRVIRPTGLTKEDGTFSLKTGDKEGAPAGDYVVTVICSQMPSTPTPKKSKIEFSTGGLDTVDLLKGAYDTREKSGLTATIKSGENRLEPFSLK